MKRSESLNVRGPVLKSEPDLLRQSINFFNSSINLLSAKKRAGDIASQP